MKDTFVLCGQAVLLASGMTLCLAAAAFADGDEPAAGPIQIDHCTVGEQATLENPKIGFRTTSADGLTIVYTNDRDVAANEIRFVVRYQSQTLQFVDRGVFAPHAKISHEFNTYNLLYYGSSADCSVRSASFADGNKWNAPDQPETVPRRQNSANLP